jgi:hypothetical protein
MNALALKSYYPYNCTFALRRKTLLSSFPSFSTKPVELVYDETTYRTYKLSRN